MVPVITNNIDKIKDACKKHDVKALYLFGSASRVVDYNSTSDIDLLVEFNDSNETNEKNIAARVENLELLEATLQNITNRKVDLHQERYIRNRFLRYFINKDKKLVYGVS
jgi:predicted nucleotidyltransferase